MSRNRNKKRSNGSSASTSRSKADVAVEKKDNIGSDNVNTDSNTKTGEPGKDTSSNDPAWYARDPNLLTAAANIPFSVPFGAEYSIGTNISGPQELPSRNVINANATNTLRSAGICTLAIKPSYGYNNDKNSPLNVCANALYTHVRYVNSGRKNYDPADLMMYVLEFADIYSYVVWLMRIYNLAYMYSQQNWYFAKDVLYANCIDADNVVANLANFRYMINVIINKVSSFCLPGDIYMFSRRVFMFSNIYLENPLGNLKDQMYQFVPDGFYKFGFDSNGAGKLQYFRLNTIFDGEGTTSLYQTDELYRIFDSMMENITGDEDFGLMSGDILKAYGDNIIRLAQIPEEGGILPVYDPYVLSQFKNATVLRGLNRADDTKTWADVTGHAVLAGDVQQTTTGLLVSNETIDAEAFGPGEDIPLFVNKILSVENPAPGVGDVIEATRLMVGYIADHNANATTPAVVCGSEVCVGAGFTVVPSAMATGFSHNVVHTSSENAYSVPVIDENNANHNKVSFIAAAMQFKYAPIMYCVTYVEGTTAGQTTFTYKKIRLASNLENATVVTNEMVRRLHEVALLSLFYVPGVAKIV